jgi:DNA-binding IclR family transcriptional regulator
MTLTKIDRDAVYAVPALDKALDVLELLADQKDGLNQGQISDAVGRSVSQIYRVLVALERRGYIYRDRAAGLYFLSMRMFELAHRHEPVRGLIQIALPPMRWLADEIQQSCNLGILHAGRVLVLAQVESPAPFGFRVRVGAEFPIMGSSTAHVLLAFRPADDSEAPAAWRKTGRRAAATLQQRLDRVREHGYDEIADSLHPGITDIAYPVKGRGEAAVAALTVPYVATTYSVRDLAAVRKAAASAASRMRDALRGDLVE